MESCRASVSDAMAFHRNALQVIRASLIRHSSFELRHSPHPFTLPIGVNRATGLLIPAISVAAITSSISL